MPFVTVLLTEFIADAICHTRMITAGGTACFCHGLELQEEMEAKYPANWVAWLYEHAGKWEKETPDPYMEGYNAFCDDCAPLLPSSHPRPNPHAQGTEDSLAWAQGWLAGEEERNWIKEGN